MVSRTVWSITHVGDPTGKLSSTGASGTQASHRFGAQATGPLLGSPCNRPVETFGKRRKRPLKTESPSGRSQALEQKLDQKMTEFKASHGGYSKTVPYGRTARHSWITEVQNAIAPTENHGTEVSDTVAILPPGGITNWWWSWEANSPMRADGCGCGLPEPRRKRRPSQSAAPFWLAASNEGRALMRVSERDLPVDAPLHAPQSSPMGYSTGRHLSS